MPEYLTPGAYVEETPRRAIAAAPSAVTAFVGHTLSGPINRIVPVGSFLEYANAFGGLAAGRLVDALGAVRTAALSELANAAAVLPLPLLLAFDALEIWHVLVLGFLGTLVDSAASTSRQTLVPAVADAHGFPRERANALFTSAEHVAYLLGAPLAGVLIASFGVGIAMSVTVAAFVLACVLTTVIFPYRYFTDVVRVDGHTLMPPSALGLVLLTLRNALFVGLAIVLAVAASRRAYAAAK